MITTLSPKFPTGAAASTSESSDRALRPETLADYLGQPEATEQAQVAVGAARLRGQPLDHVLLDGPPGLGKTTLAFVLAREMGSRLHQAHAATLRKPEDLVHTFTRLRAGDLLFVDEVHQMPLEAQKCLHTAMQDHRIDLLVGDGPQARFLAFPLYPFTLIGATTRGGDLDGPLRAGFGLQMTLRWYSADDLGEIVRASARRMDLAISGDAVRLIATRSRGTPRVAVRLLRRAADHALVAGDDTDVYARSVEAALRTEGVDAIGLTRLDREILRTLIATFDGGPAGLEAIAATLGRRPTELAETCEPYLLRSGLILRTPRGRRATDLARQHLGL